MGVYPENIEVDVSPERLRRFFVKLDGQYQVRKSLRELCVFARHNLVKDPPFSTLDLVVCRNVLIYLEPHLQKRAMTVLHYALRTTGVLLLGASESPGQLADLFTAVDRKHKLYAKKATSVRLDVGFTGLDRSAWKPEPREAATGVDERGDAVDVQREVDRIVLGRYAPAAVVVNDAMGVLHFRGRTSPFLEPAPGQASFNVLKMAREGLLTELRAAIEGARKARAPVRREGLRIRQDGTFVRANLEVVPIGGPRGERNYLVLFEDVSLAAGRGGPARPAQAEGPRATGTSARRQVDAIRHELASTKEFLQSLVEERDAANEELRSANEEILSSNEELQSTNEELETAKEELQSVNEELTTVNEELQHRNAELTLLNNDLSNILTSVSIPMVMLGSDLRIRRFTSPAASLFNLAPADVGRPLTNIRPNLDVPDLAELCAHVIEAVALSEREIQDHDGHWWDLKVRPYRTAESRIDGCVIALTDITPLKEAIAAVSMARDVAEGVVNTVREPLLVLDASLRVTSASPTFYHVFQVSPEETAGRLIYEVGNRQWDIPALRALLRDVLERDAGFESFEVAHDFETIGPRSMLLNARQIYWEGRPTGTILLAIEDVTVARALEERMQKALAAEAANRSKDMFLATLSHELRTPLNSMLGWVSLLQGGKLDPSRAAHALEVIARNTRLQARLIEDLLDVSRIVSGTFQLDLRPVEVSLAVETAVDALRLVAETKGVHVEVGLDRSPVLVMGDQVRLRQVVGNLLSNAITFTPAGGRVDVCLSRLDSRIEIAVSDTGRGIGPELMPHLFTRFHRGGNVSSGQQAGLGLGLAIARHLVEMLGGTIRAESPGPDRGATFTVSLPTTAVAEPDEAPVTRAGSDASPEQAPALEGLRVLVVEDDADTRELVGVVLERCGATVTAVGSTREALEALERMPPDILVSDIAMAGGDGYALLRALRALPPQHGGLTPAVALSAYASVQDRDRALAAGYQAHLPKPIEPRVLAQMIAGLAGRAGMP